VYSFKEDTYKDNPILILLKDGEPVFEEAEHIKGLKFGIKKAKMIINAMAQIEEFLKGENPPEDSKISIPPGKYDIKCYCKKYICFPRGGTTIIKPYLKIWSDDTSITRIGFGLVKAEGLITLKDQIENFIRKNDNRRWL